MRESNIDIETLSEQYKTIRLEMDRLLTYMSMYATASSALLAALTIIATAALAFLGYFALSARRNARAAESLRENLAAAENNRVNLEEDFKKRLESIEAHFASSRAALREAVSEQYQIMRELVSGELAYSRSDFGSAAEHFSRVRAKDPTHNEASYYLGRSLTNLGREDEGIKIFEKLIEFNEKDARALRGLALALRFRNPSRARQVAHDALSMSDLPPSLSHDIKNEYALLLRDDGQFSECLDYHRAALRQKPGDSVSVYFVSLAEMLCDKRGRGRSRLVGLKEVVKLELEDGDIRPLWAEVILWSVDCIVEGRSEDTEHLDRIKYLLNSKYLEQTVAAHMRTVAQIVGKDFPIL